MHNAEHHVTFTQEGTNVHITGMRASVNNAVHIEIQVVKLGQERRVGNDLIDLGVSFRYPSVKLSIARQFVVKQGKNSRE
jgi:hypothetical protein